MSARPGAPSSRAGSAAGSAASGRSKGRAPAPQPEEEEGQYGEEGEEGEDGQDGQEGEDGQEPEEGEEGDDPQDGEEGDEEDDKDDGDDSKGKAGAGAVAKGGSKQLHSKFAQDPHHSKTMSHFKDIAETGFTDDHVQSFVHILTLITATLAHKTGMTAGHYPDHESAKAAHQGTAKAATKASAGAKKPAPK